MPYMPGEVFWISRDDTNQRQSHPEVFHREEVTKISNSRNRIWTDEENELLADFEIANPEMRNISQHIR